MHSRRHALLALAGAAAASAQKKPLDITEFEPRSMLAVKETGVAWPRFPVIDSHTHLSCSAKSVGGVPAAGARRFLSHPTELLPVMDAKNVRTMVNLTGGYGEGLAECIARYDNAHRGRFLTFTEPMFADAVQPGYAQRQADAIADARRKGARGLKVLKTLGLFLRENLSTGALVKVDDTRFDPMWEACAAHRIPVAMHVSDPAAFFLPTDKYNERFEELNNHPDWSFHGRDYPSNAEILAARDRVLARHPKTQFIGLHVGHSAENLDHVAAALDRYPNFHVEIGARIGELGRQPRASRRFFDKYQDRILFGTDAVPHGVQTPQQIFGTKLYEIYFRFLETEDEYFDYAPAAVPPQGRWRIYGLGLPEAVLQKVYNGNAARLLTLQS
ncbi:MAG: amidohydrolase family protein [Bryobacterales bacterium]|nr:amidohydrolase family protein [Bryobacterales bacterium]